MNNNTNDIQEQQYSTPCTTEHSLKYNPLVESITMKSVNIALLNVSHFKTNVNRRSKMTHQSKPKLCRMDAQKAQTP
jgi:hypothetical protein